MHDLPSMPQGANPKPFVKWAGGKKQILASLEEVFPKSFANFFEPFVGGGAVFFRLRPRLSGRKATLIDLNGELMNAYVVVRDHVSRLKVNLRELRDEFFCLLTQSAQADMYYRIRALNPAEMDEISRVARFLFLNKTCFNGLYRVNSHGVFNVPFGRYKKPAIYDETLLTLASEALQRVELRVGDYRLVEKLALPGDFVYFDPPYFPLNATSCFTDYTLLSFGATQQQELAQCYQRLTERGCLVMLSNSSHPRVRQLYAKVSPQSQLHVVMAGRAINSNSGKRGPIPELVVLNYDPSTSKLLPFPVASTR